MTERSTHPAPPLVVDLDGTLLKTDLLAETASAYLCSRPLRAPRLLCWLAAGKCRLKAELAGTCGIDAAALPYNEPLLAWLRGQKAQGRRLVLATASHRLLAETVARHLGLFDEVLATEGATNLKAGRKRELLVSLYGEGGYDYVGNDSADLEVWRCAGHAHVVGSSPRLLARARAQGNLGQVFAGGGPSWATALFMALRPHQWVKNLLVLVPLFAAHRYGDQASLVLALLAFLAFSLTASGVYLLNDLVDLGDDRHHPRKRRRSLASGDLSLVSGWLAWPLLLLCAFALSALLLPPLFTGVLALYFLATLAYSLRLKRTAIVDVVTLAGLYTLRIIAGVAAISVPLSFWLLTFSMFLFLSLAFVKRYSELKSAEEAGALGLVRGRGYSTGDMGMVATMGTAAGSIAVLVLALYIQDSHTAELYPAPKFIWLACPLLLYWISRVWLLAQRGQMHDDPIVFALKDRTSWLVAACFLGVFVLAKLAA